MLQLDKTHTHRPLAPPWPVPTANRAPCAMPQRRALVQRHATPIDALARQMPPLRPRRGTGTCCRRSRMAPRCRRTTYLATRSDPHITPDRCCACACVRNAHGGAKPQVSMATTPARADERAKQIGRSTHRLDARLRGAAPPPALTQATRYLIVAAVDSALATSRAETTKTTMPTAAAHRMSIVAPIMAWMQDVRAAVTHEALEGRGAYGVARSVDEKRPIETTLVDAALHALKRTIPELRVAFVLLVVVRHTRALFRKPPLALVLPLGVRRMLARHGGHLLAVVFGRAADVEHVCVPDLVARACVISFSDGCTDLALTDACRRAERAAAAPTICLVGRGLATHRNESRTWGGDASLCLCIRGGVLSAGGISAATSMGGVLSPPVGSRRSRTRSGTTPTATLPNVTTPRGRRPWLTLSTNASGLLRVPYLEPNVCVLGWQPDGARMRHLHIGLYSPSSHRPGMSSASPTPRRTALTRCPAWPSTADEALAREATAAARLHQALSPGRAHRAKAALASAIARRSMARLRSTACGPQARPPRWQRHSAPLPRHAPRLRHSAPYTWLSE